ncbi:SRPBCC domain-containing protein [Kribbella sp. DT2]|uniref:SRPBCC domain-containing protein n=1 Tax=Kribbella sp. DT2 TaxID=3393427 RepID=UPI003CF91C4E
MSNKPDRDVPAHVGRTKDAGWQIGVSKTVDRPADEVWDFVTSPAGVAIWLGEGVTLLNEKGTGYETKDGTRGELRSFRDLTRVRLTWQPADWSHETTVQLTVSATGKGKARLGVHQERLTDAAEREHQRKHWQGVVNQLVAAITAG